MTAAFIALENSLETLDSVSSTSFFLFSNVLFVFSDSNVEIVVSAVCFSLARVLLMSIKAIEIIANPRAIFLLFLSGFFFMKYQVAIPLAMNIKLNKVTIFSTPKNYLLNNFSYLQTYTEAL